MDGARDGYLYMKHLPEVPFQVFEEHTEFHLIVVISDYKNSLKS